MWVREYEYIWGCVQACILSCFSCVRLFATLWTVGCQTPLSKGFSGPKYWSGLPCPPPGDLPDLGIQPKSLTSPALVGSLPLAPLRKPLNSWVAISSSRGSSQPRKWTQVSCIAGGFFTIGAIREALYSHRNIQYHTCLINYRANQNITYISIHFPI